MHVSASSYTNISFDLSDYLIMSYLFTRQAKRTLKAHKLQDELASGKLDQSVSVLDPLDNDLKF